MFEQDERLLAVGGAAHVLYRGAPFFKSFHLIGSGKENSMQIQHIMSEPVFVCRDTDDLSVAARLMWENDCGSIPIVDEAGRAIAMLTDRDICMAAYTQGKPLSELSVRASMSRTLVICHPEDSIEQAEESMSAHQLRRLPVVTADGQPVGIVSLSDLARAAVQAPTRAQGGTNGVRLHATARTLAMICALRMREMGPRSA